MHATMMRRSTTAAHEPPMIGMATIAGKPLTVSSEANMSRSSGVEAGGEATGVEGGGE